MNINIKILSLIFTSTYVIANAEQATVEQRRQNFESHVQNSPIPISKSVTGADKDTIGTTTYTLSSVDESTGDSATRTITVTKTASNVTVTNSKNPKQSISVDYSTSGGKKSPTQITINDAQGTTTITPSSTSGSWNISGGRLNGTIAPNNEGGFTFTGTQDGKTTTISTELVGSNIEVSVNGSTYQTINKENIPLAENIKALESEEDHPGEVLTDVLKGVLIFLGAAFYHSVLSG